MNDRDRPAPPRICVLDQYKPSQRLAGHHALLFASSASTRSGYSASDRLMASSASSSRLRRRSVLPIQEIKCSAPLSGRGESQRSSIGNQRLLVALKAIEGGGALPGGGGVVWRKLKRALETCQRLLVTLEPTERAALPVPVIYRPCREQAPLPGLKQASASSSRCSQKSVRPFQYHALPDVGLSVSA